jgi:hypothetical protein
MAWNPHPHVADLRDLATKWDADQVIVLAINRRKGAFEVTTYGKTITLCNAAKVIGDKISRAVESGRLPVGE